MAFLQKILNRFNGLHYRQEYLCLNRESFHEPLYVYLVENKTVLCDITNRHCFVGYSPLVFAFPSNLLKHIRNTGNIQLVFTRISLEQNGVFRKKDALAHLVLKKIVQKPVDENLVIFYEGEKGDHRFSSAFHQSMISFNNQLYGKKPGNVFLKGNLYSQVQIGYSVPRKICLITVGENNLYNHFPTDLHGQISDEYYVVSLRHEGNACKQVEAAEKIVLSDMDVHAYKKVYSLGKNHMQALKDRSAFDFSSEYSKNFHLPLPEDIIAYKELQVINSFVKGIHKLILFRIVHTEKIQQQPSTLVHIHNCYATWRNKQGMEGNYLLR